MTPRISAERLQAGLAELARFGGRPDGGVDRMAGLPADVVRRLSSELQRVLAEPQVQETLRTAGVDLEPGDPEALRVVMADPVRSGVDLMDRIGFRPQ